jgi:hypothetical protein
MVYSVKLYWWYILRRCRRILYSRSTRNVTVVVYHVEMPTHVSGRWNSWLLSSSRRISWSIVRRRRGNNRRTRRSVVDRNTVFLFNKTNRRTNFPNLFLSRNSTYFGQFLCPSSGVFHCTFGTGICHAGFMTYTSAEYTVENSWWWAEELPETCRISWQE